MIGAPSVVPSFRRACARRWRHSCAATPSRTTRSNLARGMSQLYALLDVQEACVAGESTPIILAFPLCLTPPVSRSWTPTHPPHLPPAPHPRRRAYLVLPLRARPSPAPRTLPKTKLYFQLRGIHTSFRTLRRPPKANQSSTFHHFSPRSPPPTLLLPTLPPVRRRHARTSHRSTPRRSHYIRRYTPSGH
jgi:hypothetical protein